MPGFVSGVFFCMCLCVRVVTFSSNSIYSESLHGSIFSPLLSASLLGLRLRLSKVLSAYAEELSRVDVWDLSVCFRCISLQPTYANISLLLITQNVFTDLLSLWYKESYIWFRMCETYQSFTARDFVLKSNTLRGKPWLECINKVRVCLPRLRKSSFVYTSITPIYVVWISHFIFIHPENR